MPGATLFGFAREIAHDILDWRAVPEPVDHAGQFRAGVRTTVPAANGTVPPGMAQHWAPVASESYLTSQMGCGDFAKCYWHAPSVA